VGGASAKLICQSKRKLINMEKENADDEVLYKAAIAAAVVTIASSKIIAARKRKLTHGA